MFVLCLGLCLCVSMCVCVWMCVWGGRGRGKGVFLSLLLQTLVNIIFVTYGITSQHKGFMKYYERLINFYVAHKTKS